MRIDADLCPDCGVGEYIRDYECNVCAEKNRLEYFEQREIKRQKIKEFEKTLTML